MKVKDVTMYTCDHCGKRLIRKHAMLKHEENCIKNPENIPACYDCNHCTDEDITYCFQTEVDDFEEVDSKCLKCKLTGQLMYSPKANRIAKKYPEQFEDQVPCPETCKDQKTFDSTLCSDDDLLFPWEIKEAE